MFYFVLQTLFWLLLSFILGLIIGRWLKRILCNRTKAEFQSYTTEGVSTGGASTHDTSTRTSYSGTADKLAFRDRGEYTQKTNESSNVSAGTTAAGIATAAVAGAVSHSLSSTDDEIEVEEVDGDSINTVDEVEQVDDITLDSDSSLSDSTTVDTELNIEPVDTDIEIVSEIDNVWEDDANDTSSDHTTESTDDDGLISKGADTLGAAGAAASIVSSSSDDEIVDETTELSGSDSNIPGLDADNLQIIEGIGPKMQEILHANGVHSWKALSLKSETDLRDILDRYGDQYKGVEDLDSWVLQAKLAADGDVDELIRIQKVDGVSKLEKKFGITGSGQSSDKHSSASKSVDTGTSADESDSEESNSTVDSGTISAEADASGADDEASGSNTDESSGDTAITGVAAAIAGTATAQGLMGTVDENGDDNGDDSSSQDNRPRIPGIDGDENLQIIEGIGPAMEKVLKENGINSWSDLGSKSEADVQAILDSYGDKYKLMQPASWITEAKLAAAGDVSELIRIQKVDGISKLEKLMGTNANSGFGNYQQNDLQIVEGIGPKIAGLLNKAGINNWKELANTNVSSLQSILDAGGEDFQMANPATWAEQAALADRSDWDELKAYQDFLEGGVAPASGISARGLSSADDDSSKGSGIPGIDSAENLQIIEGIGPAMEKVLKENGINSWGDLGAKSEANVQSILDSYGDKYKLMQPASWITEAKLAAIGDVTELIRVQKVDGISKLEKLMGANNKSGFATYQPDDLQIVEGIGPKIAVLLNHSGINSWKELSNVSVAKLQGILDAAGSDFQIADPSTWAEQAGLADQGKWADLKKYQDFLDGGRTA